MNDSIVIRPAKNDDVSWIQKCVEEAYEKYIERIGKKPAPMLEDYAEVIKNSTVFVLEYNHQLAGVLVLINMEEYVLLDSIAVSPGFQGKSLGRKLMELAEVYTKEIGKNEIRLYTNEKMYENIELYPHFGYTEYERKEEAGYNRVFFKKKIM